MVERMATHQPGAEYDLLEVALERLREERPHLEVELLSREVTFAIDGHTAEADAEIQLKHPSKSQAARFLVEVKRTHLSYALVDGVLGRYASVGRPWLLCAPYVAPPMSRYLSERHISFIDATGNCHIEIDGDEVLHHVESNTDPRAQLPARQGVRAPGYKVVFAILARPDILESPVRLIEGYANTTKSTVSNQLRRLESEGILARARGHFRLVRPRALFDKWVTGYADVLRPWLMVGRYDTPLRDAEKLEQKIEHDLPAKEATGRWWWWGGGSAAWRVTKHYRSPRVTLHVDQMPSDALRRLRALPSARGSLEILRIPNFLALGGPDEAKLGIVHPLLVYAELMTSPDERAREAAVELRERSFPEYAR